MYTHHSFRIISIVLKHVCLTFGLWWVAVFLRHQPELSHLLVCCFHRLIEWHCGTLKGYDCLKSLYNKELGLSGILE